MQQVFTEANPPEEFELLVPANHRGGRIVCAAAVRKDILKSEPEWIDKFPENFRLDSKGDDDQTSGIDVLIDRFSRPVLHFEIQPRARGKRIHIYVCHLKSKSPTAIYTESWYSKATSSKHAEAIGAALSTIRRTAEAAALRMILTERMLDSDTPVVVIGDLNDNEQSNTLNIITGQPNYLLSGFSSGGSDVDLYSAGALQKFRSQRDVYYTHIYKNNHDSLDHILVSQEFYDNSKRRIWAFKGMEIVNDHLNDHNHKETGTTDHAIVKADFEYRPAR